VGAGGRVVTPRPICVGLYAAPMTHHNKMFAANGRRDMLRQPEACTCTRHDTAPARTEEVRTAAIRAAEEGSGVQARLIRHQEKAPRNSAELNERRTEKRRNSVRQISNSD
jgi:hypothetical protein